MSEHAYLVTDASPHLSYGDAGGIALVLETRRG